MTPCSAAACGSFSSRESSRSTCVRTRLGQLERRELLAQLVDLGLRRVLLAELLLDRLELLAQDPLALALLHLGRGPGSGSCEPIATMSSSRARISDRRRRRRATSTSSSSAWRSSVLIRSAPAIRWLSADGSSRLATAICSSSGRYGTSSMICAERLLHVAHQRGQLGALLDHVRQLGDAGGEVGLAPSPSSRCARAGRPGRGSRSDPSGTLSMRATMPATPTS